MGKIHLEDRTHNGWGKWETLEKEMAMLDQGQPWFSCYFLIPKARWFRGCGQQRRQRLGIALWLCEGNLTCRCMHYISWWFRPTKCCCNITHLSAANTCKGDQWCFINDNQAICHHRSRMRFVFNYCYPLLNTTELNVVRTTLSSVLMDGWMDVIYRCKIGLV